MSIDQFASYLSEKLGNKLNKSEEEINVLKYGIFTVLHTISAVLLTAILGVLTNTFMEIMIISITAAMLKRFSGGIHASSPLRCIFLGSFLSVILAFICKYLVKAFTFNGLTFFSLICLSVVSYILYKKCPVGNKNKPLKKESTRMRLRKRAFKFIISISILLLISLFIYITTENNLIKVMIISIELGLLLQILGLTRYGEKIIYHTEHIFDFAKIV